jgi:hydroxymethylpyrimidine pyrophosphatase-like HAD family hydrolase
MSNVSLVISDVDGTLLTKDKVLTARAQAEVKAVQDAGIAFAITSRRPPRGMAVARCEADLRRDLGTRASIVRSQPYYIDVTHPDANKGVVVGALSSLLHVPARRILTIGDMPSDTLMFRKSGVSVAMGNAEPEVKALAQFVTDSNEEEGFAKAIERFVLVERDPP